MRNLILTAMVCIGPVIVLSGCATISEDDCLAGNWAERGFKDGSAGASSSKLEDYAQTCGEFNVAVDRPSYLRQYERGLLRYCTYDNGFSRAESGSDYNAVCNGALAVDYQDGYDDGKAVYEIHQEHKNLISAYEDIEDDIEGTHGRLSEEDLTDDDIKRLNKKLRRMERELEELRIDIRAHERLYDLPRHRFY